MNKPDTETTNVSPPTPKILLDAPRIGEARFDELGMVRVMAIAQKCWVVYRRPHFAPVISHVEMFNRLFKKESA